MYPFLTFSCIVVNMEMIDARKHNQQTQYELRKQVVWQTGKLR